jgi:hypothetical protein
LLVIRGVVKGDAVRTQTLARIYGIVFLTPHHPGYYAAFALDPDGNNIEAVYHGAGRRSAAAVRITF